MIAHALEVPVVGRALLTAARLTDGTVHIENQCLQRPSLTHRVDPATRQIHERCEILLRAENVRLETADLTGGSGVLVSQRCSATNHVTHRWVDSQSLGVVDILVACQSAVYGLTQQRHKLVLLVAAQAAVFEGGWGHFSQPERLIEFAIRQQSGIGCDLATEELEFQAAVKTDSQIVVFGVTHRVPLLLLHVERHNHCFSKVWRKLHAEAGQLIWEMRAKT